MIPTAVSKTQETSGWALGAGVAVVVMWASAFHAIRVAPPQLGVIGLSVVRLVVATAALLLLAPIAQVRVPRRADLALIVACALVGMTASAATARSAVTSRGMHDDDTVGDIPVPSG